MTAVVTVIYEPYCGDVLNIVGPRSHGEIKVVGMSLTGDHTASSFAMYAPKMFAVLCACGYCLAHGQQGINDDSSLPAGLLGCACLVGVAPAWLQVVSAHFDFAAQVGMLHEVAD